MPTSDHGVLVGEGVAAEFLRTRLGADGVGLVVIAKKGLSVSFSV
jgi:hypothetical protein